MTRSFASERRANQKNIKRNVVSALKRRKRSVERKINVRIQRRWSLSEPLETRDEGRASWYSEAKVSRSLSLFLREVRSGPAAAATATLYAFITRVWWQSFFPLFPLRSFSALFCLSLYIFARKTGSLVLGPAVRVCVHVRASITPAVDVLSLRILRCHRRA